MTCRTICLLLAALFAVFLSGCDKLSPGSSSGDGNQIPGGSFTLPAPPPEHPEAGDARLGMLYYPDLQWRFLVPVHREIPYTEAIARTTLEHLVAGPQLNSGLNPYGLSAPLPQGTTVLGIAINEGVARVDLSESVLSYSPEEERLVLGSILCTLMHFSTIERVEVLVDGDWLETFPGGTPGRLPFGPECWINLEVEGNLQDYRNYTAVKLYFCYISPNGRTYYVPVNRILEPRDDETKAALQELLAGPRKGSGLFSDIPPGTELLDWSIEESLLTVNLSEQLLSYQGGRTGAENLVNQLLLTLSGLPDVEEVQILVEGQNVPLRDYPDLVSPISPPESYNYITVTE